jgi:hypothetical protein
VLKRQNPRHAAAAAEAQSLGRDLGRQCMTIQYFLWPGHDLAMLSDNFAVSGCRVRLMGAALSIECEPAEETQASRIVQDYVEALRQRSLFFGRLLSWDEYGAMPPRATTLQGKTARESARDRARLRDARRSIVEPIHSRLSQCYDYLQLARDEPKHALFNIYKLIETIEGEYGGEREAIRALDDAGFLKRLKRQANQPDHDQRHAPVEPGTAQPIDERSIAALVETAHALLAKYEAAVASALRVP